MRPPICSICESESFDEGGLVYFKKRASDDEWDRRMKEEGMVGHPPYADWFCSRHFNEAESLRQMTIDEARKIMKE